MSLKAQFKSICNVCRSQILKGDEIRKLGKRFCHVGCVDYTKNKGRVSSGETFRSRKPSDYRRKTKHE